VLVFEPQTLYNLEGELPGSVEVVDLDHAAIRRPGNRLTIVTYGATLYKALDAAEALAAEGLDAEVIDLRTLRPLDMTTIEDSVRRTKRVVIADEGWRSGSVSAELAARLSEHLFFDLEAPIARVCSAEVPIPYPKHLEDAALPQPATIAAAARALVH
jgi:pyruvate/2-oxoglutarate/acetoin dehydrogenase E1 component